VLRLIPDFLRSLATLGCSNSACVSPISRIWDKIRVLLERALIVLFRIYFLKKYQYLNNIESRIRLSPVGKVTLLQPCPPS
jgi:hypothetical protein